MVVMTRPPGDGAGASLVLWPGFMAIAAWLLRALF